MMRKRWIESAEQPILKSIPTLVEEAFADRVLFWPPKREQSWVI